MNTKRNKVLILAQSFIRYKGDITSAYLFNLARKIVTLGFDIEVLSPHETDLPLYQRIDNISIYRFRYGLKRHERLAYRGIMHQLVRRSFSNKLIFVFFLLAYFYKALKIAKKEEIKLIHAHWWIPSGFVGVLVSLIVRKPLVVTTHGTDIMILGTSGILRILGGFVFRRASHITVVSSFLKKKLLSIIPIAPDKITVLPMPANVKRFSSSKPVVDFETRPKDTKTILCVARYTKQKRLDTLIDALALLKNQGIGFKAILIGEGGEEENLKNWIRTKSLSEEVTLLPLMSQDELSRYYRQSDVLVLPSVDEGFGLVLVEAQLCQTPVIGADSGGIPDIIEAEKTGLLFPPGNAQALASNIKRILTDEDLARKLSSNAFQMAHTRFSPENIAKNFIQIYDTLIKNQD